MGGAFAIKSLGRFDWNMDWGGNAETMQKATDMCRIDVMRFRSR